VIERLSPPVPLELMRFGLGHTLRELHPARVREGVPLSPDGGVIADYFGPIGDPRSLAARLSATAGVVEHGLFAPELVSEILFGVTQDGGGVIIVGGKVVRVPPRSPEFEALERLADLGTEVDEVERAAVAESIVREVIDDLGSEGTD